MPNTISKASIKSKKASAVFATIILFSTGLIFLFFYCKICMDNWTFLMLFESLFMAVGLFAVYYFMMKRDFSLSRFRIIVPVWLVCILILQLIANYYLEITPMWDMGEVYNSAISWAEQGNFNEGAWYLYKFPNNIGILSVLALIFRCGRIFSENVDYGLIAGVVNAICNTAMIGVVFLICKRLVSIRAAYFSLILFTVNLPTFFCASVYYTDVMSMLYPVLFYYLYLRLRDEKKLAGKIILIACMGLSLWLGAMIKFTVMIVAVALLIEVIIKREWKLLLMTGVGVFAVYMLFNTILYEGIIYGGGLMSKEEMEVKSTPYTHWLMMGLQGDGGYNGEDYELTDGIEDPMAKREAISAKIDERLSEMGVSGWIDLAIRKIEKCFCNGTYDLTAFFYHGLVRQSWLNNYVVKSVYDEEGNGEYFDEYRGYCSSVYLGIFLLMGIGALLSGIRIIMGIREKRFAHQTYIVTPVLCIFGLMLFLALWETAPRYIVNMEPMIFICGVLGAKELFVAKNLYERGIGRLNG